MDQETDEQRLLLQQHKCRLCSKSFSCGRSLGGHMRCHLSSSPSATTTNGYGLRENPKKTWRLSSSSSHPPDIADIDDDKQRQCRDCGKNFPSWQALFGHMRCHKRPLPLPREEAADSWTVPRKKRMPRHRCASASASSSASEYEQEQVVDVAITLMMLSRDAGYWSTATTASAADSADRFKKPTDIELYSDGESGKDKKRASSGGGKSGKKSLYECTTCNKSFHSYQALGGHRAGHKRGRGCLGESSSFDTDASTSVDDRAVEDGAGEVKGSHQCGICGKVFGSGQALGGHKRSHLATSSVAVTNEDEEEEEEKALAMADSLDLNLPAAAVADAEFESWWAGSNLRSEAVVGMIA